MTEETRYFLFFTAFKPALKRIQAAIHWIKGDLSLGGQSDQGMKLTTHLRAV
jgi:hypothetical protein